MTEKMWVKVYDAIQEWDRVDKKVDTLPWIDETRKKLESTLLSDEFRYSTQIPVIKEAITEAFGKYAQNLRFVNRFLLVVEEFMEAKNSFDNFKWEKKGENWEKIDNAYRVSKMNINTYLIEYWREMFDEIEGDNKDKDADKVLELSSQMNFRFIDLLSIKLKYVPKKDKQ